MADKLTAVRRFLWPLPIRDSSRGQSQGRLTGMTRTMSSKPSKSLGLVV
jgi:hypothetical protein